MKRVLVFGLGISGRAVVEFYKNKNVELAADIMFVNNIPFLLTISRGLRFGTVEVLQNRQLDTVATVLKSIDRLYRRRGFRVTAIHADPEFAELQPLIPAINTCSQDDHVPDAERFIRTVKDRARSTYRMLPFSYVPRVILVHLIKACVFWINAFPAVNGASPQLSPRFLLTGWEIDFHRHVRLEFGSYVQAHEDHDNSMAERTTGAICLGPDGSKTGGHYS